MADAPQAEPHFAWAQALAAAVQDWLVIVVMVLAIGVVLAHRKTLFAKLGDLTGIKGFGFELSFAARKAFETAVRDRAGTLSKTAQAKYPITLTDGDRARLFKRLDRDHALLKGKRILWVDDIPHHNLNEERFFEELGARIRTADDTGRALMMLQTLTFDLIVSDIARGDDTSAGLTMLADLPPDAPPVIFYIGELHPTLGLPRGAFGLTNRPDELVHLALDVFARRQ